MSTAREYLEEHGIFQGEIVYTVEDPDGNSDGVCVADLMEEYASLHVAKSLSRHNDFMGKLEKLLDEDDIGTDVIGEFVMDYFDLWR